MAVRKAGECVRCGLEQGYHRAVVDVTAALEIGSLCRHCDAAAFERTIGLTDAGSTCALCPRDGLYALPEWLSLARRDGDVVVYTSEYEVTDDTLFLCDEHFFELTIDEATTVTVVSDRTDRR